MDAQKRHRMHQMLIDIKELESSIERLDDELVDLDCLLDKEVKKIHKGINIAATDYTKYHNRWHIVYEEIETKKFIVEGLISCINKHIAIAIRSY